MVGGKTKRKESKEKKEKRVFREVQKVK